MEENGVTIVKSGTDFRNYTEIRVSLPVDGGRAQIVCTKHDVTSECVTCCACGFLLLGLATLLSLVPAASDAAYTPLLLVTGCRRTLP